jgi:hypothetical protein
MGFPDIGKQASRCTCVPQIYHSQSLSEMPMTASGRGMAFQKYGVITHQNEGIYSKAQPGPSCLLAACKFLVATVLCKWHKMLQLR